RAGLVLCRAEHAAAVDKAVFPGLQGGPLCHIVAAKAVCFKLAATESFREYQQRIVANAKALGATLMDGGLQLLTGGTDIHLLQLDLRQTQWSGKDAEERLAEVSITVNRNTVPYDERPPTIASGVRIGTPAATMRGFTEDDMREVGAIILETLEPSADLASLRERTRELLAGRPLYSGLPHGHPAI
ncbi:MAG: serine hydroxymethyltransferase, partial [Gaiellales bacterium]